MARPRYPRAGLQCGCLCFTRLSRGLAPCRQARAGDVRRRSPDPPPHRNRPPRSRALPANIEAGGGVHRRGADRQPGDGGTRDAAAARAFLRAGCTSASSSGSSPCSTGRCVVTPVTLKPYFESGRGAQASWAASPTSPASPPTARACSPRANWPQQIYDLALLRELVSGRAQPGRRRARHLGRASSRWSRSSRPKPPCSRSPKAPRARTRRRASAGRPTRRSSMIETAINSGGHVSGKTTGLTSVNEQDRRAARFRPDHPRRAPGHGQDLAGDQHRLQLRRPPAARPGATGSRRRSARASPSSASKCRADQLATRILAEQAEHPSAKRCAWARSAATSSQQAVATPASASPSCRSISTTPRRCPIAALRTRARRLKRRHDIGLIVVDYLQLLQGSGRASDNRVNEISEISRGLKTLAKELHVPVIALSQLSRAVEQREDKRPMLSDLRESGSIEQDADMVWFVYREDYYVASREPKVPTGGDDMQGPRRRTPPGSGDGARLRPRRTDRGQAAPRLHRQGAAAVRSPDHPLHATSKDGCGYDLRLVSCRRG